MPYAEFLGSGASEGVQMQGEVTSLRWGTAPLWGGVLVVLNATQRTISETDYLTNGAGVRTVRIQTVHGATWNVTVRDDSRITDTRNLNVGRTLSVFDYAGMFSNTVGAAQGFVTPASGAPAFTVRIIESDYETGQKRDGTRNLTLEFLNLIEGY